LSRQPEQLGEKVPAVMPHLQMNDEAAEG